MAQIPDGLLGPVTPIFQYGEALGNIIELLALCSLRFFVTFMVLPATGQQFIQGMIRNGFVLILGFYVAFGQTPEELLDYSALELFSFALKECMIGLLIGFAASTVFWTAECVGAMLDTQTGYNNVQLSNPMSGQQSTPISGMLLQMMVSVFYVLGGMLVLIGVIFESFKIWPIRSTFPSLNKVADLFVIHQLDTLMTGVVKFSAPILLILLLIDLGFGLVTRAADKLEPSSLSQPVKGAVGVLLLSLLVGLFTEQVRRYLLPLDLLKRMQGLLSP
jgi:type III secretion protein T